MYNVTLGGVKVNTTSDLGRASAAPKWTTSLASLRCGLSRRPLLGAHHRADGFERPNVIRIRPHVRDRVRWSQSPDGCHPWELLRSKGFCDHHGYIAVSGEHSHVIRAVVRGLHVGHERDILSAVHDIRRHYQQRSRLAVPEPSLFPPRGARAATTPATVEPVSPRARSANVSM